MGFVSLACVHTSGGQLLFFPIEFVYDLTCFLACASLYYWSAGYRGGGILRAELQIPKRAGIMANISREMRVPGARFFDEPLDTIETKPAVSVAVDFNDLTGAEIRRTLPAIMHHVARGAGRVLSTTFEADVEPLVEVVLKRVGLTQ